MLADQQGSSEQALNPNERPTRDLSAYVWPPTQQDLDEFHANNRLKFDMSYRARLKLKQANLVSQRRGESVRRQHNSRGKQRCPAHDRRMQSMTKGRPVRGDQDRGKSRQAAAHATGPMSDVKMTHVQRPKKSGMKKGGESTSKRRVPMKSSKHVGEGFRLESSQGLDKEMKQYRKSCDMEDEHSEQMKGQESVAGPSNSAACAAHPVPGV